MAGANDFDMGDALALLTRTPASLNALLRGLPDTWARCNEGEQTWSAYDIVGHLIVAERTDWMPRVRSILDYGETRPFPPFDRFAQMKGPQDRPIAELLDEFTALRNESLAALESLKLRPSDFDRRGTHPALGPVTLSQLLATWTIHDVNHIHQLSRVLARRYGEAVGPWKAYLGVLQCDGHSA